METLLLSRLALVTVHFTYVTPLNPQEYKLSDAVNKVGYYTRF